MVALVKSNNFAERAEHILPYQDDNTTQVKNAVTGVKNNAAELLQVTFTIIKYFSDRKKRLYIDKINKLIIRFNLLFSDLWHLRFLTIFMKTSVAVCFCSFFFTLTHANFDIIFT